MSRKVEQSASSPPDLPSSVPQTLWARHHRTVVILLIGALAVALSTAAAIFLDRSSGPEAIENPALGEVYLEEKSDQFVTAVIWIAWCVGVVLIGVWARSELRHRPTDDHDAEAVHDGDQ